jgi:hypothetical protein
MCELDDQIVLPIRLELLEQLADLDPRPRVEAGRRLVQQQHLRVVQEHPRDAQPLLHAAD